MHREIQIKQFPIVTTHWWPKTRNERFVWENEQYLYHFLPLVHNHVQVIWVRTRIRCVTCVCARALAHAAFTHATSEKYVIGCFNYDGASAPCFRHALRQALTPMPRVNAAWARARAHTRHTPDVCALRSLGHGCSFSHTNRSFRVLGHQCVVTMGNCLIWISLCMLFFPLIETVTYTCHYMTDRLERFDLKTSKLDLLKKKKTPTSWMPLG